MDPEEPVLHIQMAIGDSTSVDIRNKQLDDPSIGFVLRTAESGKRPGHRSSELAGCSREDK